VVVGRSAGRAGDHLLRRPGSTPCLRQHGEEGDHLTENRRSTIPDLRPVTIVRKTLQGVFTEWRNHGADFVMLPVYAAV